MKYLLFIPLAIIFTCFAFPSCQVQNPPEQQDEPELTARLTSSESFHYHDGQSNTGREVILDRYADGSVTLLRRDIPLSQVIEPADLVTLDSDPVPTNSTATAIYGAGTDTWFIPFGNGPAERLDDGGVVVDIECACLIPASPFPNGHCFLETFRCGRCKWQCRSDGSCVQGCTIRIIFSGKEHHGPGIMLKTNQLTIH